MPRPTPLAFALLPHLPLGGIGLIVTLWRSGLLGRATVLRSLGRMALTVYTLQALATSVLFYGLDFLDRLSYAELAMVVVGIWMMTGAFCMTWLHWFGTGPMENLLRVIAYQGFPDRWRRRAAAEVLSRSPSI